MAQFDLPETLKFEWYNPLDIYFVINNWLESKDSDCIYNAYDEGLFIKDYFNDSNAASVIHNLIAEIKFYADYITFYRNEYVKTAGNSSFDSEKFYKTLKKPVLNDLKNHIPNLAINNLDINIDNSKIAALSQPQINKSSNSNIYFELDENLYSSFLSLYANASYEVFNKLGVSKEEVIKAIIKLPKTNRKIFEIVNGLINSSPKTFEETSEILGIKSSSVRTLYYKSLREIKDFLDKSSKCSGKLGNAINKSCVKSLLKIYSSGIHSNSFNIKEIFLLNTVAEFFDYTTESIEKIRIITGVTNKEINEVILKLAAVFDENKEKSNLEINDIKYIAALIGFIDSEEDPTAKVDNLISLKNILEIALERKKQEQDSVLKKVAKNES